MIRPAFLSLFLACVISLCNLTVAIAQEKQESSITVTELARGLKRPTSIVGQPGTKFVFVCESDAGRILAFSTQAESAEAFKQSVVVEGISSEAVKPTSLAFLNGAALAVGSGLAGEANEQATEPQGLLSVFDVKQAWPQSAEDRVAEVGLPASTTFPKLDRFDSLAVGNDCIYWTTTGDPKLWLAKAEYSKKGITANTERRWLSLADMIPKGMTVSTLTFSPDGYLLMGLIDSSTGKSAIHFVDVSSKAIRASFAIDQTGLRSIAYSPNNGRLFAIFRSEDQPDLDGLYKLVARKRNTACESRLVTKIADPTSMTFIANGKLLVTTDGPEGKILLVDGIDPVPPKNEDEETGK